MRLKTKKILLVSLFVPVALVGILALTLFTYQKVYAGKIYNNVYFGEINLSGKTKVQAEYLLKNKIDSLLKREIKISANGKAVTTKLSDTGLIYNTQQLADQSYKIGRDASFLLNLKSSVITLYRKVNLSANPEIDQNKYKDFLDIAVAQLNTLPQDATLAVQNGEIILQNSSNGQSVDTAKLTDSIVKLAENNQTKITLAVAVTPPKISTANFDTAKRQATDLLAKKYIFTYQDRIYSPTKAQIGAWIEFVVTNGLTIAQFNTANVKAYLNNIGKNFEVSPLNRKINASTGEIIDPGRDGVALNKDTATVDLQSQLSKSIISVTLATMAVPAKEVKILPAEGLVLGRFDGRYIDVDLTAQKLCRIEGQNLIDCTIVSTGKASMPTPTGTFSIFYKSPRQWSTASGLWMPWFEEFKGGGYGLHELPEWPNGFKEGADHLGVPVSHGCIRLGIGPAQALYDWTSIGTPIYIHK